MITRIFFIAYLVFSVNSIAASLEETAAYLKKLDPELYGSLSQETLSEIETIRLTNGKVTDEDLIQLAPLCQLTNIESLDFKFNRLTGKGLKVFSEQCKTWDSVSDIDLGGNPLVDEYLTALNAFPNLKFLNIDFHDEGMVSQVTGEFFKTLALKRLSRIWAAGTNISDEAALTLLEWPALKVFNFYGAPIKKETFERLGIDRIDMGAPCWSLERIQFQAQHTCTGVSKRAYDRGLEALDHALSDALLTKDAYQWAKDNDIRIAIIDGRIFSVIAEPNENL